MHFSRWKIRTSHRSERLRHGHQHHDNYNTAVNDAASEVFGKECRRKKPWVTSNVLDFDDEKGDLKKKRYKAEGAKAYWKQTTGFQRQ